MSFHHSPGDTPTVLQLPPEIFPQIVSHLPLQLLPTTVSNLAIASNGLHSCVQPLVYRKVIIKNVPRAFEILDRMSLIGPLVWELHIRLDLSDAINIKLHPTTVLMKLQEVIETGLLPQLKYLGLVIVRADNPRRIIEIRLVDQYRLPRSFFETLRRGCPLLQGLCLDGVVESSKETWMSEPNFYDLKHFLGLTTLKIAFGRRFSVECSEVLFKNIHKLASSLKSLTLLFDGLSRWEKSTRAFSITLPNLIAFDVSGVDFDSDGTTELVMAFLTRHPKLERLGICMDCLGCCFSPRVQAGLLPRLTHLKSQFSEVRALESHLNELEHLSIKQSYNFQVPYLLRHVLPHGLPLLKSLEIHSTPMSIYSILSQSEGATWYVTEDGQFREEKRLHKVAGTFITNAFIQLVVEGAPNLEELCLHCFPFRTCRIQQISPILGQLKLLERFFYPAFADDGEKLEQSDLDDFLLRCRMLGNSCSSLIMVTDVSFRLSRNGPYLKGTISRDCDGAVVDVVPDRGFGMESTGGDDDPFPLNRKRR